MNRSAGALVAAFLLAHLLSGCVAPVMVNSTLPSKNQVSSRETSRTIAAPRTSAPPAAVPYAYMPPSAPSRSIASSAGVSLVGKTVVVDAGHGGKDGGTTQLSPVPEKVIVLDIAKEVERQLRDAGATVVMTRSGDTYPTLDQRAALADSRRADLLVSIHADSAESSSAQGLAVWVAPDALTASRSVADSILVATKRAGVVVRGIRTNRFRVLVGHSRPSVLVECGFLSNHTDAKLLNQPEYRKKLGTAIAAGIVSEL